VKPNIELPRDDIASALATYAMVLSLSDRSAVPTVLVPPLKYKKMTINAQRKHIT